MLEFTYCGRTCIDLAVCLFFWRVIRCCVSGCFSTTVVQVHSSLPQQMGIFTFMSISYMLSACFILCQPPSHLFLTPPAGGRTDMSNRSYIKSALTLRAENNLTSEKPCRSVTFDLLKWKNYRQPDLLSILRYFYMFTQNFWTFEYTPNTRTIWIYIHNKYKIKCSSIYIHTDLEM